MKALTAASDAQLVLVQYVLRLSFSNVTFRLPSALAAWRAMRSVWRRNDGRYRHERTRRL